MASQEWEKFLEGEQVQILELAGPFLEPKEFDTAVVIYDRRSEIKVKSTTHPDGEMEFGFEAVFGTWVMFFEGPCGGRCTSDHGPRYVIHKKA